jgi:DNA-binding FrmR family transcriptional regulator
MTVQILPLVMASCTLAAVQSALRKVGKMILTDHIEHCVLGASAEGGGRAMEDLSRALDQFLK